MTKFQKQMLTIAAAGALTAVTALPAMAFENVFSGTYTVKGFFSNYDNAQYVTGLGTQVSPVGRTDMKTSNYIDQRLRIGYTAKASDDLKLVTQFEMNTKWGNTNTAPIMAGTTGPNGQGLGGGIDTDGVNIATRWAYLDFNIGKSINVKAGQQAFKDQLKGLYVDADLPALQVAYTAGAYKLNLVYSRFNDVVTATATTNPWGNMGDASADLFGIENSYSLSKNTKVALVYYLNTDNTRGDTAGGAPLDRTFARQKKINTFGVSGETQFGSLNLSSFAAMQSGYQKNAGTNFRTINYHGWATATNAKMKVGTGAAKMGFLFASGNGGSDASHDAHNNAWQTLSATNNSAAQNSYNESGMMILARNTSMGGTNTDNYFRKPVSNIALLTMGYDANLTDKLYMNGNVGFAWAPSSQQEAHQDLDRFIKYAELKNNGSDFMGTEINLETGYKLYKNLTLKAQAAYVVLGGYYKNSGVNADLTAGKTPDNPFSTRLAASFSF